MFFHAKNRHFCEHRMATMVEVFDGAVVKKNPTIFR